MSQVYPMRPLEAIFVATLAAALVRPVLPARWHDRSLLWLPVLAVSALLAHVLVEGARWQLAPAYGVTGGLVGWTLLRRGQARAAPRALVVVVAGCAWLLLGGAGAVATLIPVAGFPAPSGPHPIGTVTYHWVDAVRGEPVTADPADVRELMVQLWYPAAPGPDARPAPYMADSAVAGPQIAQNLQLPRFFLDHMALLRGHAVADAPPREAAGRVPVLVFSHGNTGVRTQNTVQFEELASHGYLIASIDHTYNSGVTVFPDGRVVLYDRDGIQFFASTEESERRHDERVMFRAADVSFVVDQLERMNAGEIPSPFAGRLDLDRLGVFGHSYGGATAAQAAAADPRIKAGINLDGWHYGDVVERGYQRPFMAMGATVHVVPSDEALVRQGTTRAAYDAHRAWHNGESRTLFDTARDDAYFLRIAGMAHYNFSDIPLISPLTTRLGLTGPIDGRRGLHIINAYTLAFFDHYLRGLPAPLLDGPSPAFPEVEFRSRRPGAPAA